MLNRRIRKELAYEIEALEQFFQLQPFMLELKYLAVNAEDLKYRLALLSRDWIILPAKIDRLIKLRLRIRTDIIDVLNDKVTCHFGAPYQRDFQIIKRKLTALLHADANIFYNAVLAVIPEIIADIEITKNRAVKTGHLSVQMASTSTQKMLDELAETRPEGSTQTPAQIRHALSLISQTYSDFFKQIYLANYKHINVELPIRSKQAIAEYLKSEDKFVLEQTQALAKVLITMLCSDEDVNPAEAAITAVNIMESLPAHVRNNLHLYLSDDHLTYLTSTLIHTQLSQARKYGRPDPKILEQDYANLIKLQQHLEAANIDVTLAAVKDFVTESIHDDIEALRLNFLAHIHAATAVVGILPAYIRNAIHKPAGKPHLFENSLDLYRHTLKPYIDIDLVSKVANIPTTQNHPLYKFQHYLHVGNKLHPTTQAHLQKLTNQLAVNDYENAMRTIESLPRSVRTNLPLYLDPAVMDKANSAPTASFRYACQQGRRDNSIFVRPAPSNEKISDDPLSLKMGPGLTP